MTRKKGVKPEGIGGVINQVIKKLDAKTHGQREDVVKAWQDAIDHDAVKHTKPVAIKKNILTIEVDSSARLYILNLKKKDILASMQKAVGKDKIEEIRFRIGEIS